MATPTCVAATARTHANGTAIRLSRIASSPSCLRTARTLADCDAPVKPRGAAPLRLVSPSVPVRTSSCVVCRGPLVRKQRGRPRLTCSNRCRQARKRLTQNSTADRALRRHGFDGERLLQLSRRVAADELHRRGAYLPGPRLDDLTGHLVVVGLRSALSYDANRSGANCSFASFFPAASGSRRAEPGSAARSPRCGHSGRGLVLSTVAPPCVTAARRREA